MMKSHRAYPIRRAFQALLRSVLADGMFVALLIAPPLLGAALRFGLPALISAVPPLGLVANYKPLWDALLYLRTPYMTLFSSCMVALEERDNGVCLALVTTPLGKAGYLASRFLLPALFAALYSALCAAAFSSVPRPLSHTVMLSLPAAFTALTMVAFIPAFARDKIVGMAMSKLCGLLMLTVAIPFFLPYKWQPLLCWLPSYWFYRFLINTDWLMAVMCLLTGLAWLAPLVRRFSRRALR